MKLRNFFVFSGLLLGLFTQLSFAKTINMYEQPKKGSKIISTIDTKAGIINIFTPEESLWTKVADPRNGNVGWIEIKELNDPNTVVSYNVTTTENGGNSSSVVQFGNTGPQTKEQLQNTIKALQQRQQELQQTMQKMMK